MDPLAISSSRPGPLVAEVRPSGLDSLRLLSISHRTAPLSDLESLALDASERGEVREHLRQDGIESVVLCTCNRTELYWCARELDEDPAPAAWLANGSHRRIPPRERFATASGIDVAQHLFRVTAGLESLVVGESEILGQVREAIDAAENDGSAGFLLSSLFHAGLRFGGRARSETRIGTGALSVASASVQLLARIHEALDSSTVVVLGSGATGVTAARHLRDEGVGRLVLLNRTLATAEQAARDLDALAGPLEDLPKWLSRADAVLVAVSASASLVTPALLHAARGPRPARTLALVDLSLPRAVEPACAAAPRVLVHDLSGLEQIVAHNRARREREIPRVVALIEEDLERFEANAREAAARPLVAEIRQRAEAIRLQELEHALSHGAADDGTLDRVTRRLVQRLLHAPSRALRRGSPVLDPQHALYLRSLFGLASEDGDGPR